MSVLEFIASIVRSLAWPIAVCAVVFWLRQRLGELLTGITDRVLPNLRKLHGWGIEAQFESQSDRLARTLPSGGDEVETTTHVPIDVEATAPPMSTLAENDQRAAVLTAFVAVEVAAREAVTRALAEHPGDEHAPMVRYRFGGRLMRQPGLEDIRWLQTIGLGPGSTALWKSLVQLRNLAAHDPEFDVSRSAVDSFLKGAAYLTAQLNAVCSARPAS